MDRTAAYQRLCELKGLPYDWDSYGGQEVDSLTFLRCTLLINTLPILPDFITICSDGAIQMEWHRDDHFVELEVGERVSYLYGHMDHDVEIWDEGVLPCHGLSIDTGKVMSCIQR